jgi:hypothetical protein
VTEKSVVLMEICNVLVVYMTYVQYWQVCLPGIVKENPTCFVAMASFCLFECTVIGNIKAVPQHVMEALGGEDV